ncbi:hypothetical protein LTR53_004818 [Teratosphaeriaceae sp. CCFEE 6253]|nr:hypothetical protein LTR53_004818 [Teratosphaeriaceae sp. CCFEE 6253]
MGATVPVLAFHRVVAAGRDYLGKPGLARYNDHCMYLFVRQLESPAPLARPTVQPHNCIVDNGPQAREVDMPMSKRWGVHHQKKTRPTHYSAVDPATNHPHSARDMLGQNKGRSRQAGNPWAPDPDDRTKYAPSQTLRDLVSGRMVEQRSCQLAQQKRVAKRVEQLDDARRAARGGPKGPGDQQLSAQTVKAITCDTTAPQLGGGPYGMGSPMCDMGYGGVGTSGRSGMRSSPHMNPYVLPPDRSIGTGDTKRKAPLERYEQLQSEIDALLAGFMASEDPMLAMEATTLMCHPGGDRPSRVRVMMFERLVAAPGRQEADSGSEEEEEEDDAASEPAEEEDERGPVMLAPPRQAPRQAPNPPRGYMPQGGGGPGQRCPPPPQQHAQPPPPGGAQHPPIQRAPPPQQNMQPPAFGDPRHR